MYLFSAGRRIRFHSSTLEVEFESRYAEGVWEQVRQLGGEFREAERVGYTVVGVEDPRALAQIKGVMKKHGVRFRNRVEQGPQYDAVEIEQGYWEQIKHQSVAQLLAVRNSAEYRDRCVISFK